MKHGGGVLGQGKGRGEKWSAQTKETTCRQFGATQVKRRGEMDYYLSLLCLTEKISNGIKEPTDAVVLNS